MEYKKKSFSVPVGSKKYRDGWDRIFDKSEVEKNKKEVEENQGDKGVRGWVATETIGVGISSFKYHVEFLETLTVPQLKKLLGECKHKGCRISTQRVNEKLCRECKAICSIIRERLQRTVG